MSISEEKPTAKDETYSRSSPFSSKASPCCLIRGRGYMNDCFMEDVNVNRENVVDIDFGLDDFVINHPCTSLQMLIRKSCGKKKSMKFTYLSLISWSSRITVVTKDRTGMRMERDESTKSLRSSRWSVYQTLKPQKKNQLDRLTSGHVALLVSPKPLNGLENCQKCAEFWCILAEVVGYCCATGVGPLADPIDKMRETSELATILQTVRAGSTKGCG